VTVSPKPHWAIRLAAYVTPACVLPSSLWRLHAVAFGNKACFNGPPWEKFYVSLLSVVSFAASCLTIGLVSEWGERFPTWIPVVSGRAVPRRIATTLAGAGTTFIFLIYAYAFVLNPVLKLREPPPHNPACLPPDQRPDAWIAYAAYAPLLLWGPLLLVVTIAYHRRRSQRRSVHPVSARR
jgi:hypothetical protein